MADEGTAPAAFVACANVVDGEPCGRRQAIRVPGTPGGVTVVEAQAFGWTMVAGEWRCPFCADKLHLLLHAFERRDPSGFGKDPGR